MTIHHNLTAVLSVFVLLSICATPQTVEGAVGDPVPGEFIIQLNGECIEECRAALQSLLTSDSGTSSCTLGARGISIGGLTFETIKCSADSGVTAGSVTGALTAPSASSVGPPIAEIASDTVVGKTATPTDLWGIDETDGGLGRSGFLTIRFFLRDGLRTCSMVSNNGANVNVWIIDTGCPPENGGDCWSVFEGDNACVDVDGHGTHVGGTATDPVFGVAPAARRSCVKALNDVGDGSVGTVLAGLEYAVNNRGALSNGDVINMSLGGPRNEILNNAVEEAGTLGIYFAIAAGNEAQNACAVSPASAQGATIFTVQAHDVAWNPAVFTNFATAADDCTDMSGPGVNILSFGGFRSGTSMASPHVAGACALLLSDSIPPSVSTLTANGRSIMSASPRLDKPSVGVPCAVAARR